MQGKLNEPVIENPTLKEGQLFEKSIRLLKIGEPDTRVGIYIHRKDLNYLKEAGQPGDPQWIMYVNICQLCKDGSIRRLAKELSYPSQTVEEERYDFRPFLLETIRQALHDSGGQLRHNGIDFHISNALMSLAIWVRKSNRNQIPK
jgi:hypothetical protein